MNTNHTPAPTAGTHTPGEWRVHKRKHNVPQIVDADGMVIAAVYRDTDTPIVASAPALLAALEAILQDAEGGFRNCNYEYDTALYEIAGKCRDALSLARGGASDA